MGGGFEEKSKGESRKAEGGMRKAEGEMQTVTLPEFG